MNHSAIKPATLDEWLAYIEALHPKSIAMGLERVQEVAKRLELSTQFPIVTIAGTNGKGSTCAILEAIYLRSGYRVGCYASPHLLRYNERVRINQQNISNEDLCKAFAAVETARGDVELTYFEMGTLAAMWHFVKTGLDLAILEVGMGGRLDAVNVFDPACAIVTGVDLDHMEFLGSTREKIGYEKAGIFRAGKPAICGDESPPTSLIEYAEKIHANLLLIGRDFKVGKISNGWQYVTNQDELRLPNLALHGDFQLNNAACAITAIKHLQDVLPVPDASIGVALKTVTLTGRFEKIRSNPDVIADVAHNPQAAQSLAHNLQTTACKGRTLGVLAMLADKDINGVVKALHPHISHWYLADIHNPRGAKAKDLHNMLENTVGKVTSHLFESVGLALQAAYKDATKNDRIIVFGSFYTVADAIADLSLS